MTIIKTSPVCETCNSYWCVCDSAPASEPKVPREPSLHDQIVLRAEKWLTAQGCKVVIRDPFRSTNNENPDAIGWRSGVSIMIEVKTSRSDFLADKKKLFRQFPQNGMGDWRIYMCPPELIQPTDLPIGWGLLWVHDKKVRRVHGIPKGNAYWGRDTPFAGNKNCENTMLLSALRRLAIRGYLPEIYEGAPS